MDTHFLLKRLDEIGQSLERNGHALALIGLGSVGVELDRLDSYSDLDFFVIVEPGNKNSYMNNLDWLNNINKIAYHFQNTKDGYKLLFEDGIFCEFAIFEPNELETISLSDSRIVWKMPLVADIHINPHISPSVRNQKRDKEWHLGEALTNLYVGMMREKRGENLSAMRFIQGYAVDHLLELAEYIESPKMVSEDEYAKERRFEQRFSSLSVYLPGWLQGYKRNSESALEILAFLKKNFEINEAIYAAIQRLCL